MDLTSPAFQSGNTIPEQYSCTGAKISPGLMWRDIPDNTQSFALIVDDPDAPSGMFTHWVLYDIPPDQDELEEDFDGSKHQDWGAAQGRNDFGNTGYGPPCPPVGETHKYFFRLYALDTRLQIGPGATRAQVIDRMQGHILDNTELIGTYQRV